MPQNYDFVFDNELNKEMVLTYLMSIPEIQINIVENPLNNKYVLVNKINYISKSLDQQINSVVEIKIIKKNVMLNCNFIIESLNEIINEHNNIEFYSDLLEVNPIFMIQPIWDFYNPIDPNFEFPKDFSNHFKIRKIAPINTKKNFILKQIVSKQISIPHEEINFLLFNDYPLIVHVNYDKYKDPRKWKKKLNGNKLREWMI